MLYDLGLVSTPEPFQRLVNQGMILGEDNNKMSKSRGNVVNPDEIIERYGADSMRLYEMFMGPLEAVKPWKTQGVEGVRRFLDRVWRLIVNRDGELKVSDEAPSEELLRALHKTIQKVGDDIDTLRMNTAIASMMELSNLMVKQKVSPRAILEPFIQLLAPFAPHIAEELWSRLGHEGSIGAVPWPAFDEALLVESTVTYPIQVNGKLRAQLEVSADEEKDAVLAAAKALPKIQRYLEEGTLRREIFVPGRMVNLVIK